MELAMSVMDLLLSAAAALCGKKPASTSASNLIDLLESSPGYFHQSHVSVNTAGW